MPAFPSRSPALGINQLCGSGLRAVAFGWQAIRNGDANIMVVGGQESMSHAPHAAHLRDGTKMGELKMVDTMIKDGLWTPSTAITWATPPRTWRSNTRSPATSRTPSPPPRRTRPRRRRSAGRFKDEIVPVTVKTRKGDVVVDTDEYPAPRHRQSRRSPSCARPSRRTARSPPATPRASTTAPRRWC